MENEFERKWLLRDLPEDLDIDNLIKIYQYYLKEDDGTISRVRNSMFRENGKWESKNEYIRKDFVSPGHNTETKLGDLEDKDIWPLWDEKGFSSLEKTRYIYNHLGHKFEVDVYESIRLVTMEVELTDLNETIIFPKEIAEAIIMEVTGIVELSNFELATKKENYVVKEKN